MSDQGVVCWPRSMENTTGYGEHQANCHVSKCFAHLILLIITHGRAILVSFYTKSFVPWVPVLSTFTCWTKDGLRTPALSHAGDAGMNRDLKLLSGHFPVCLLKVSQSSVCSQNTTCFFTFWFSFCILLQLPFPPVTPVLCSVARCQIAGVVSLCILACRALWWLFSCTLTLAVHTLMFPLGKCWCLCFAIKPNDYLTVLTYGVCCTAGVFLFSCSVGPTVLHH